MTTETQDIVRVVDFELPSAGIVNAENEKIAAFQTMVHTHLKEGHDYGVIPGTRGKPTLLKPGAEKICSLVGLSQRFELIGKTEDWDKGLFVYEVKCSLVSIKTDQVIAEGLGECNSYETKYRYRWQKDKSGRSVQIDNPNPANERNTILKMAKKRAHVDAALNVAALSNLFTQDIEDMPRQQPQQQHPSSQRQAPPPQASYREAPEPEAAPVQPFKHFVAEDKRGVEEILLDLASGKPVDEGLAKFNEALEEVRRIGRNDFMRTLVEVGASLGYTYDNEKRAYVVKGEVQSNG